jgi:hypothetical protein
MSQLFGTDRVLLYDVDPWNRLGFGVPNFGSVSAVNPGSIDTIGTLSMALWSLADEVATLQLFIMTHVDATRTQPPSRNTIERIGKMLNRVSSVLAGRQMETNKPLAEPNHFRPAPKIWNIHPVPYFGGLVRNHWLMEFNEYVMIALTNFYQHSDNNIALEVTKKFAEDIYQYFALIKKRMGYELLKIPVADLEKPEFLFTQAHYDAYLPNDVITNIEALDGPGNIFALPTEVDLRLLLQGIPANLILPVIKQYPIGPIPGATGLSGEDTLSSTAGHVSPGTGSIGGGGGPAIGPGVAGDSTGAADQIAGVGPPKF